VSSLYTYIIQFVKNLNLSQIVKLFIFHIVKFVYVKHSICHSIRLINMYGSCHIYRAP